MRLKDITDAYSEVACALEERLMWPEDEVIEISRHANLELWEMDGRIGATLRSGDEHMVILHLDVMTFLNAEGYK